MLIKFYHARKGSTEEQIRKELEEGVAVSVFHSSIHLLNPDPSLNQMSDSPHISLQNCDGQCTNIYTEQQDKFDVCDPSNFSQSKI